MLATKRRTGSSGGIVPAACAAAMAGWRGADAQPASRASAQAAANVAMFRKRIDPPGGWQPALLAVILNDAQRAGLANLKEALGRIASMHILLIEDDLDLGRALHAALKVEG